MALARTCSECPNSLEGKGPRTVTCSNACRLRRSRRIRRANARVEEFAEANNVGAQEIAAIVRREAPDVVTRVMKEEIRPIVRESLDEDVLRAIHGMVGLTPAAVQALEEDLLSDDKVIRQRAYSLVIKYTVGHPALVKDDVTQAQQLVVNFGLPRPDADDLQPANTIELHECDMCHEPKPASEFVAGSDRCTACFAEFAAKIRAQFA